jgi:hypothetical protein
MSRNKVTTQLFLQGLSSKIWLEVVSFDESLLKGEAPRFSADFNHHLSCKEAF